MWKNIIGYAAVVLVLLGCARNPVTGKKQFGMMSEEREIALGTAYDPQIVAQFGLYDSPQLQQYIEQKGQQMAQVSHRNHLNYEFKIVDSPIVNAFAVPGGFVYFTRGIMAHFNNEAEFAGVLGHEIGHITARHSVKQQRDATLMQVGLIAGMIAKPELAQFANSAGSAMQLLMLKFGRDAESQSDELGVEYSSKIGYDAQEMAGFFNTLARKTEQAGGSQIPEFMSTHPNPLNRKEKVGELAGEWQRKLSLTDPKVGRDKYLSMLNGLVYGEDPRQGFVENSTFYHPDLEFEFPVPNGWQYQNSPQAFQMAPSDGKALMSLTAGQGTSPAEQAQAFAQEYNLEVLSSQGRSINGIPAHVLVARTKPQQTADGQQAQQQNPLVKIKLTVLKYGDLLYNLMGVAAEPDFPTYDPLFENTMSKFEKLTDADKLSRQPEVIKVVTVKSAGTLASALSSFSISADRHEEFAIVNGMEVNQQLPAGTKIKVVELRKN